MAQFGYKLNEDGRVIICGYGEFENYLTGNEPFQNFGIIDYKLVNEEWIYNPIIMVPEAISKLQATKHMLNIGRHDELMAIIDEDTTGETRLLYDASYQLYRNSSMVNQLGAAMGYDSDGLDNLFIEANKILL